MLRFPADRRVPPPDLSETGERRAAPHPATPRVRAIVHPRAAAPPAPSIARPLRPPAPRLPPRALVFAARVPPPGVVEQAAARRAVRARVFAKAHEPAPERAALARATPRPPRPARTLVCAAEIIRAAPELD